MATLESQPAPTTAPNQLYVVAGRLKDVLANTFREVRLALRMAIVVATGRPWRQPILNVDLW
jgi:hypothetical protein